MAIGFWQLPEQISVAITAPQSVMQLISNRIVVTGIGSADAGVRTVRLDWTEAAFHTYQSAYWQPHFTQDDVVWRENGQEWLFMGYGFFLAYSQPTESAQFFITSGRLDDVLTYSYPFLNLLIYLLSNRGYACLHAAVIGSNDHFALIPGKQNTGKSTTSATWVLNGGQFVTDDFCFMAVEEPTRVHGFYPSLRLREEALPLLQKYLSPDLLQQQGVSKYFYSLLTQAPECFVTEAHLRSILCLTLHNRVLSHVQVSPKIGYDYLASSVAFSAQYRSDSRVCLQVIKKLVWELPVLQVNLSPNTDENYHYLRELMASPY